MVAVDFVVVLVLVVVALVVDDAFVVVIVYCLFSNRLVHEEKKDIQWLSISQLWLLTMVVSSLHSLLCI